MNGNCVFALQKSLVEKGILCPMTEDVKAHMIVPVRIKEF